MIFSQFRISVFVPVLLARKRHYDIYARFDKLAIYQRIGTVKMVLTEQISAEWILTCTTRTRKRHYDDIYPL